MQARHPLPRWQVTVAAAGVGLGAHFANVLPDLVGDRVTGVRGLPHLHAALGNGDALPQETIQDGNGSVS